MAAIAVTWRSADIGQMPVPLSFCCVPNESNSRPAGTPGALKATVADAVFLGEILRVDLSILNGASLQMRRMDCAHLPVPAIGSEVCLRWAANDCWMIE